MTEQGPLWKPEVKSFTFRYIYIQKHFVDKFMLQAERSDDRNETQWLW